MERMAVTVYVLNNETALDGGRQHLVFGYEPPDGGFLVPVHASLR
jgi:hypothetical protein